MLPERAMAQVLARVARAAWLGWPEAALFACGGDTAAAVCGAWGAQVLVPGVAAGIPRGVHASTMEGIGVRLYTKPGSYGETDTLCRLVKAVLRPEH